MSTVRASGGDIVGTILNQKYQVLQRLSQGGMGVVYKARHLALDTPVALKVLLKPESTDAQQRFLSEARLASKVRHPNTVYIADFGVFDDGRAFLEMEFLEGRTLAAAVREGPMDPLRACQIAMQIARGLAAVHEKGIIHRDMKPDNVFLLEQDGSKDFVKIVDFGIAKATHGSTPSGPRRAVTPEDLANKSDSPLSSLTQAGTVMGTPGFMAPEQAQGFPLSFRVDQYALGCIFYEMVAGRPVFSGPNAHGLLMKHITNKPEPLRTRRPDVLIPKGLDEIALRLLAKNPNDRFGSMREAEQALQALIDQILLERSPRLAQTTEPPKGKTVRILGAEFPLWLLGIVAAMPVVGFLLTLGYGGLRLTSKSRRPVESISEQSRELLELRQRALTLLRQDAQGDVLELRYAALAALGATGDSDLRIGLQAMLAHPDRETRAQAAAALGSLGDRRADSALLGLLPSPAQGEFHATEELPAQLAAAAALRQLGDARGTQFLEQLLDGKNQDAQLRAALLFCGQGPPNAQRVLRAYLQRSGLPGPTVQNLLTCLARAGDTAALERLKSELTDVGPPALRLSAAITLATLGDADGLNYLREELRKRTPNQLRAARELALLDNADGLELLRQVSDNRSAQSLARQWACDGLGALGELPDARKLAGLFPYASDPALAQAAARAVMGIASRDPGLSSTQSLSWAEAALGDSDALVRQTAAEILGDNLNAGAVSLLAGLLKDGDARVRHSAALALSRHKDAAAVQALREALQDRDPKVRVEALRALLRIGDGLKLPKLLPAAGALQKTLTALLSQSPAKLPEAERLLAASLLLRMGDGEQLKNLQSWLGSTDIELRRLALEQLPLPADKLAELLSDKTPEIQYLAARKLAELHDTRAAPVLREIVARGGADALWAHGLLSSLGVTTGQPDPIVALLADKTAAKRTEAVEALRQRPGAQALPLLEQAARDREVVVRWSVAEVAAALAAKPDGGKAIAIVRRLAADSDPMVRMRASTLLFRLLHPGTTSPQDLPTAAAGQAKLRETAPLGPLPDAGAPPASTGPADGGSADGGATDGGNPLPQTPEDEALNRAKALPSLPLGPEQALSVQIEQLVRAGLSSFERKDYKKAQRQLAKALGLCSKERRHSGPCVTSSFDIYYRLGQIHEQQKSLPDAMNDYQQVLLLSSQVHGKGDIKTEAQKAVQRLAPRLGQVILSKRTKHGCQVETNWLRPITTSLRVDGKTQQIEVKPGTVIRVGTCG
jgi:serine/threonine protein kinase/HEAT repeat protein